MQLFASQGSYSLDPIQRFSMALMSVLVLLTFVGTNMQALLWQSSDWLVSTVLPAVVVDLTNKERSDLLTTSLIRNSLLDQAAQAKAEHMAKNQYFAHFAPDGTTPWEFFQAEGYVYAHAGENLAIHFTDSSEVVEAWMLSPAHRKNIVDPKFLEIGVGTARGTFDGYDTVYVVQLFGTPAIAASVAEITAQKAPLATQPLLVPTEQEVVQATEQPSVVAVSLPEVVPLASEVSGESDTVADSVPVETPEVILVETVSEPVETAQSNVQTSFNNDIFIVETELATSSGLAVATMIESSSSHAGATVASIATRPNLVLQLLYGLVTSLVVFSLLYAMFIEARRLHYVQIAYSFVLLFVMGGLWFLHTTLTSGAVII